MAKSQATKPAPRKASPARTAGSGQGDNPKPGYYIEALGRGIQVLDAFSSQRPELTLRDIADVTGVSQPSALRIGYTLVQTGYLVRNPLTKGYRLGPKIVSVGMETLNSLTLPELAEPYLVDLRDRTQETVKLAIHAGPVVVFVARIPSLLHPHAGNYIGSALPIHASSLGRVILAHLPKETAEELVAESQDVKLTMRSLTKAQALRSLPGIRARGYELNDQGVTSENRAIAAPVLDATGTAVGAINLSVSAQRVSLSDLERRMAPLVLETAQTISSIVPLNVQGSGWVVSRPAIRA